MAKVETKLAYAVYIGNDSYLPGDDVPEKVARQMGAHCFEDGVHPYPPKKSRGPKVDSDRGGDGSSSDDDEGNSGDDEAPEIPPMSGRGSGDSAWLAYAEALGVEVPEGAKRDAIVAAVREAGHPVEAEQQ